MHVYVYVAELTVVILYNILLFFNDEELESRYNYSSVYLEVWNGLGVHVLHAD